MNVFAEYEVKNGSEFRKNTILQFGDSWELKANFVMLNPGSAIPKRKLEIIEQEKILDFLKCNGNRNVDIKKFYKFSSDTTMNIIKKIFSGYFINNQKEFEGVINIFNLFELKDSNSEEAIKNQKGLADIDIQWFCNKLTYFGFGSKAINDEKLLVYAKKSFENTPDELKIPSQRVDFCDAIFYHPLYLQRSYKNNENAKKILIEISKFH